MHRRKKVLKTVGVAPVDQPRLLLSVAKKEYGTVLYQENAVELHNHQN